MHSIASPPPTENPSRDLHAFRPLSFSLIIFLFFHLSPSFSPFCTHTFIHINSLCFSRTCAVSLQPWLVDFCSCPRAGGYRSSLHSDAPQRTHTPTHCTVTMQTAFIPVAECRVHRTTRRPQSDRPHLPHPVEDVQGD